MLRLFTCRVISKESKRIYHFSVDMIPVVLWLENIKYLKFSFHFRNTSENFRSLVHIFVQLQMRCANSRALFSWRHSMFGSGRLDDSILELYCSQHSVPLTSVTSLTVVRLCGALETPLLKCCTMFNVFSDVSRF